MHVARVATITVRRLGGSVGVPQLGKLYILKSGRGGGCTTTVKPTHIKATARTHFKSLSNVEGKKVTAILLAFVFLNKIHR